MVTSPSYLKTLHHPLQIFSTKPFSLPSQTPSSSLSSMKVKALIHTLIVSHICRVFRALCKAKSILIEVFKEHQPIQYFIYRTKTSKKKDRQRKIFFGSFRLHYNWAAASSHVLPEPEPVVLEGFSTSTHFYYDSTWNSIITTRGEENPESQLSGYLHWLEENKVADEKKSKGGGEEGYTNDIDRLADMFIASCHEKFRLEKQESYRRFQEMMARSM